MSLALLSDPLTIETVEPLANSLIRVRFSRALRGTGFLDFERYLFTGGDLHCVGVLQEDPRTLLLMTTEQETDRRYNLQIRKLRK